MHFLFQAGELYIGIGIGGQRHVYISYQHMHNYIKTQKAIGFDEKGLQKFLLLARINSRQELLLQYTNLIEFIKKTEALIEKLKPFSQKTGGKGASMAPGIHAILVMFIGMCYLSMAMGIVIVAITLFVLSTGCLLTRTLFSSAIYSRKVSSKSRVPEKDLIL